jgi:tetratricopeptide (TPR) repeat protein
MGQNGQCCINEYRALLSGELVFTDADNAAPIGRFNVNNKTYLLEKLNEADSIYRLTRKLEDYSDLGSMFIYTGQYLQAKQIFQDIEQKTPGLYQTAANLGTTYELLGQNDSALYWIKRAVEINPNSHRGSEWIHVKILEAKVKANGDEKKLWTHSILSLDFGDDKIPVNKTNLDLQNLRVHLYDQLNERMSFIKPKDPIVAQLLFDLGNVCALTMDATSGLQVYQSAKEYGYKSDLFDKRQSYFEKLQLKADFRNNTEGWAKDNPIFALIIVGTIFVGGLIGIIFLFRRIKKRRHEKRSTNR